MNDMIRMAAELEWEWFGRTAGSITVNYESLDGVRKRKSFSDVAKASAWAQKLVGKDADIDSGYYAVDIYGTGKVTVDGARLADLWPERAVRDVGGRNMIPPDEFFKQLVRAVGLKPVVERADEMSFEANFPLEFGTVRVTGFEDWENPHYVHGQGPSYGFVTTPDGGGGNTKYHDPKDAAKEVHKQIARLEKIDKAEMKRETGSLFRALSKAAKAYASAWNATSTEGFDEWAEHDRRRILLDFSPETKDKRFWDTVKMMPQAKGKSGKYQVKAGGIQLGIHSQGSYGGYVIVDYPSKMVKSEERRTRSKAERAFSKEMHSSGWWN